MTFPMNRFLVTCCFGLVLCAACSDNTSGPNTRDPYPAHVQTHVGNVASLSADESAICELVLRDWLLSLGTLEPVEGFVAVGRSADERWLDPPADFMQRMIDVGVNLRKASEARIPKPDEMVGLRRYRSVEHPETGKPAFIHYVVIARWRNDREAEVVAGAHGGPLSSHGYFAVVEKKDGRWQFKGKKQSFLS